MIESDVLVELNDVLKIFKQGQIEVVALRNINLTIKSGEIIVIMGPSGSGKTTLLNIMSGLEKPNAGTVKYKNIDIPRLNDDGIQKILQCEIGIIFQFFNLIPTLTAAGNIEMPLLIVKTPKSQREIRILELLKSVKLEHRANHRPFSLSGGEKQRVAIAMAFANNPSLILADEPTGNIDSVSAEMVMDIFKNYIQDNPEKAIVIVTHDATLRKIATRTLIIRDGQIVKEIEKNQKLDLLTDIPIKLSSNSTKLIADDISINDEFLINKQRMGNNDLIQPEKPLEYFKQINKCHICNTDAIYKAFDKERGYFYIHDSQVAIRSVIFCEKCKKIYFRDVGVYDIKKDLVE